MIDGDKHRDLALTYDGRGQVGAPHRVYRRRDDGAVVVARASGCPDPGGREQVVRAHEPQHATLGCAKACHAQPGPDLAVTLTVKGAGGQNRADRVHQRRIRHRPNPALTPSARESISRSSPRNRRRTASRLRWRDMRPPRPKPTVPEAAVSVVIVTLLRITSAYKVSQRTGERSSGDQLSPSQNLPNEE